jgi:hypothetical protein
MELRWAEIFRDGGSLGAAFLRDGKVWALFLKIGPWGDPGVPKHHMALRLSADESPERGRRIARGSDAEREIFAILDAWLAAPAFSDSSDRLWNRDNAAARVADLRQRAETRTG